MFLHVVNMVLCDMIRVCFAVSVIKRGETVVRVRIWAGESDLRLRLVPWPLL